MNAHEAQAAPATVAFSFLDFGEGGAQRLALDTMRQLDPDRFRPVLVCARGRGSLLPAARAAGIPVRCLGRLERGWDLGAVIALAGAYRALDARIVQVPLYSRVAPYARLAARLAGVRLTLLHEHSRPAPPRPLRRAADRALARLLPRERYLAVSQADRAWLLDAGLPDSRIAVLHNGIDVERFAGADRAAARRASRLPAEAPILLVPARLHPQKRHVDLLAALAHLAPRLPDLQVLCAGDGPLRDRLEALARSAGLDDRVRFLGHREDLPTLLAAADLVVLPSRIEGLPLAILEAQASGRAVLATAVGGLPELIQDGRTGRLVPPGRPAALADAIASLLSDRPALEAMGARARAQARRRFRIQDQVRQLENLYTRWLEDLAPRRGRALTAASATLGGRR